MQPLTKNGMKRPTNIPALDCPKPFLFGDASGKIMNEFSHFPCQLKCGVYALVVCGEGHATINITRYTIKQGDLLILEPGTFFLVHDFTEETRVYYTIFSSSFLENNAFSNHMSLTTLQVNDPVLPLPDDVASVTKHMLETFMEASNCQPSLLSSNKMLHIFNLLQTTYSELVSNFQHTEAQPMDRKNEIYQEYCQLVMKHYREWHHVTQYAEAMRLTLPHLSSTIKQASAKTAGDLINEAIITDAKAQLKLTTLQIKEVAISLGFENVAFFNRFFKSHTGMTPKSYRLATL